MAQEHAPWPRDPEETSLPRLPAPRAWPTIVLNHCPYREQRPPDKKYFQTKRRTICTVNKIMVKEEADRANQISKHESVCDSSHLLPLLGVLAIGHNLGPPQTAPPATLSPAASLPRRQPCPPADSVFGPILVFQTRRGGSRRSPVRRATGPSYLGGSGSS